MGDRRRHLSIVLPIVATVFVHGALAGGLQVADDYADELRRRKHRITVEFDVAKKKAPKPPEPPKPLPPPPPPPKPVVEEKQEPPPDKKLKKVAKLETTPAPPKNDVEPPPDAPDPPPGPDNTDPAEEYDGPAIKIDSGQGAVGVRPGKGKGSAGGVKNGKGKGPAGGGEGDKPAPKVASVASIKKMPEATQAYDHFDFKRADYPPEALAAGIDGDVSVSMVVTDTGTVADAKIVKGRGYGLDAKALQLVRKFRFKPAIDTNGKPVALRITWTFHFTLPD